MIRKKKLQKNDHFLHLKFEFYRWKNIFLSENRVHYDGSDPVYSDETIRIYNFPSAESFGLKKSAENCHNGYVAEKRIVSKLSKISISNLYNANQDLSEFDVPIFNTFR